MRNQKTDKEILEEVARIFGKHSVIKSEVTDNSLINRPSVNFLFLGKSRNYGFYTFNGHWIYFLEERI